MDIRKKIFLGGLFGIFLGLSYAPFPTGYFAFLAFVPLFIAYEKTESLGSLLRFSYGSFFLYNLITLYWPGGFTHGKDVFLMLAGGSLILAHPMFYFVPIAAFGIIRKRIGFMKSLCLFPFFWVGFEYLDSATQFAFPWLTLGTTQAGDLSAIQFSSITGVYGISFWILCINIAVFVVVRKLISGEMHIFSRRSLIAVAGIIAFYGIPKIYGAFLIAHRDSSQAHPVKIGIVQPNIDPFEKWDSAPDPQLGILQEMTNGIAQHRPDLVIWPETAVPFYLLDSRYASSLALIRRQIDSLRIPLLAGIPDIVYYRDSISAPPGSKRLPGGIRYETFNSSMLMSPESLEVHKYAKMLLVPFAERVPYSDVLDFLNAARWNFGLGGWNNGREANILRLVTRDGRRIRFSTMICYESIFPGFVARFVHDGAEFLTVITNDSWWGNTSGAYQHVSIEVLRAVENGRWLVQCSNGGISCVIDPNGRIINATRMFTRTTSIVSVEPISEMTFYSAHGDWFAGGCASISAFAIIGFLSKNFYIQRWKKKAV